MDLNLASDEPYPTWYDYQCYEHPDAGWIIDRDLGRHLHRHPNGMQARTRSHPLPRPGDPMPELIGWPPDVRDRLILARANDPVFRMAPWRRRAIRVLARVMDRLARASDSLR